MRGPRRLALLVVAVLALVGCEAVDEPEPPEATPPDTDEVAEPEPDPPDDVTPEPTPTPDDEPTPDEVDRPNLDAVDVALTEVARAEAPAAGAAGPDGNLWVAERGGRVRILDEDGLGEPVVDLSAETTTDVERGLLGIAFSPDLDHLYLSYTNLDGDTRVDTWALDGQRPDDATRRTVFAQEQPFGNHNGGDIAFGPDGLLYIGLGDGGGAGDPLDAGQDLGTHLAKLLRIDPQAGDPHGIPDDNPFVDEPDALDAIWAYGLRNPWRFTFDAETGDLWIADVGQADREEVNVVPAGEGAGANFGWNLMEGTLPFAGDEPDDHWPPVFEYDTTAQRCAITGGYVYRGEAIPDLRGAYLFSDYCEGVVRALDVRDGEVQEADLGVDGGQIVSFAQAADGELYALDLGGGVFRLTPA